MNAVTQLISIPATLAVSFPPFPPFDEASARPEHGLMRRREASINDLEISEAAR